MKSEEGLKEASVTWSGVPLRVTMSPFSFQLRQWNFYF